jgi:hypothetical protein
MQMEQEARVVIWRGEEFRFEPLRDPSAAGGSPPVWAVSRRGEFIGTMPYLAEETLTALHERSVEWLDDLLG